MRSPLLLAHSLRIHVKGRRYIRVPEQFALHLHIRTVCPQQGRVAVPEGVPAYPLRDARSRYGRPHEILQCRIRPIGLSPVLVWRGKDPIGISRICHPLTTLT